MQADLGARPSGSPDVVIGATATNTDPVSLVLKVSRGCRY